MAESAAVPALVLQLQGVRKTFNPDLPNAVEVLHGIDLTLHAGEFCAVVGPSGSGKSTLLNIVGLLDRPTAGTVTICGQLTQGMADRALTQLRGHRIGFVFQYHHLLSAFTALENVLMPLLADAGTVNQQMVQRATDLLDQVGLHAYLAQPATQLSGGQQQRVALARALAMQPALLLADEATGNLDTVSADAVFALLRDISRSAGMAVLFVTHNEALASRCDRTINVVDGLIIAEPAADRT